MASPGRISIVGHGNRSGAVAYVALALGLRVADHRVRAVARGDLPAVDPPMGRWPRPTILDRLTALAAIDAIAGQEPPLVAYLRGAPAPVCDEVTVDAVGNLDAVRRGPREGPTVMVAAHTDEIGLVVKAVAPNGFLRFEKVGCVLDNLLPARLVRVDGRLGDRDEGRA